MRGINYFGYLYTQKILDVINLVAKHNISHPNPLTILDAGCRYGTEAIHFATLDVKVIGIDINKTAIKIALKRKEWYQTLLDETLDVNFVTKNILDYTRKESVDIIWASNSVSHIHPVERFLKNTYKNLKPGGCIIVCDANKYNPHVLKLVSGSWKRIGHIRYINGPEGYKVPIAVERVFSARELSDLLKKEKLLPRSIRHFGFLPNIGNCSISSLDRVLGFIPLINRLGVFYSIVGEKY